MIKQCRSCHGTRLVEILSLGNQYLSAFIKEGESKPGKYPLNLVMCRDCTLLQLKDTVPPREMYNDNYGFKSGINNTIKADLKDIVDKAIEKVKLEKGDLVISIGENDGTLLSFVPYYAIKVGVEPVKKLAEECKKHADIVINDFWSYEAYEKISYKVQNLWENKISIKKQEK